MNTRFVFETEKEFEGQSSDLNLLKWFQNLDFLVFDYLSEVTMSLLTAAQQKNPELGFAPDFVIHALGPYLRDIKDKGETYISFNCVDFYKHWSIRHFIC